MKIRSTEKLIHILAVLFFSCLLYAFLFLSFSESLNSNGACISLKNVMVSAAVLIALILYGLSEVKLQETLAAKLYNYRLAIAVILFALLVAMDLNGTSLSVWQNYLTGAENSSPLFGKGRGIRSDEWAVWSVYAIAQGHEGWPAVSSILSGGTGVSTLWESVGGIPAINKLVMFKPLYWGFLILGTSHGFSWLWCGRIILLFTVSYEFAQLYTEDNKYLSVSAAFLITFTPMVQWFLSQSIAEVLIFGQLTLLMLYKFAYAEERWRKLLYSVIAAWSLGCYLAIAYIGWLISVGYVLIALILAFIIIKRPKLKGFDVAILLAPFLSVCAWCLYTAFSDIETLQDVMNSVYPGGRVITGGGLFTSPEAYPSLISGIYSAFTQFIDAPISNNCEFAGFVSLAPAGIIIALSNISRKKVDIISVAIIILEAIFSIFLFFGFPENLARITLLSNCSRLSLAIGFADTILLFRGLKDYRGMGLMRSVSISALLSFIYVFIGKGSYEIGKKWMAAAFIICFVIFALIFYNNPERYRGKKTFAFSMALFALCMGGFVNPIQKGTDVVTNLELVQKIEEIGDNDSVWFVEGNYPYTNVPMLSGKKCFDSTQVYPDTDRWGNLDPTGEYAYIYNRFCHLSGEIVENDTSFELLGADCVKINLCHSDLEKSGIDYLITRSEYDSEYLGCEAVFITNSDGFNIYKLNY